MLISRARLLAFLILQCLAVFSAAPAQNKNEGGQKVQKSEWTWEDGDGKNRTWADLDRILEEHKVWLESEGKRGKLADLKGAKLRRLTLVKTNLSFADVSSADLSGSILMGGELNDTDLSSTKLWAATLFGVGMRGAVWTGADMAGAYISGCDLQDVIFEPTSNPMIESITTAHHLELVTYVDNPNALVRLRKQFQDGGFRLQERMITYALNRRQAELDGPAERWFKKTAFDWTCHYGMSPGRPLVLGFLLWFMCSCLYFACIHMTGKAGLSRVYGQGLETDPAAHKRVEEIRPREIKHHDLRGRIPEFLWREWLVFRTSMFFSLMSAFNIGFRDINFGRWLRLLTREEFDIKAVGWARVVAGWQALISVGLFALAILTYFGRPFG